ncbi:YkgJ family cysteine cluster protein [Natronomonas sp.]|uniref:YkgJ family cysteine cluster protein n=1 Tax=Natronomonas sp. TaxID=2184060 RepID=UPI002FC3A216
MDVNCEGCAGCCIDWRGVAPSSVSLDHERRGGPVPIDDTYNLVPLSSDEVRRFLRDGLGDVLTPRPFADPDAGSAVTVDGHRLAAIDGRPAFLVGLRKVPKPVGPFGVDPEWLPSCAFLDPETLQCRIHDDERYPDACSTYPGDNLALDAETECERVEGAFGGDRLLDDDPDDAEPLLGVGALGATVFAHPDPEALSGRIERIAAGDPTDADRAEFVAVAAASRPGTLAIDEGRYEDAYERVLAADSWAGRAREEWTRRAEADEAADPTLGEAVEDDRGAPTTPGWD